MNQIEAIKAAMKHRNVKPVYVAQKLGISEPTFSRYLSRKEGGTNGNLRLETLCKILEAIDYEIIIKPKDSKTVGAYSIHFDAAKDAKKGDANQ